MSQENSGQQNEAAAAVGLQGGKAALAERNFDAGDVVAAGVAQDQHARERAGRNQRQRRQEADLRRHGDERRQFHDRQQKHGQQQRYFATFIGVSCPLAGWR